ncbi:mRNA decay activator protein ZFP36L1 [Microplitis demolitor]|uniref:mRNA decay activator protein ZFP36L1 n=1 Tax=Microplitis demolitor TaxID=69319 RepID=UPI0004CDAF13|nr:mRNA decay activator protein ZFP36L1 [Microplitis demolitor]
MSTAVMSTPIYECNEHLFKSAGGQMKSKESMNVQASPGHIPLRRSYTSLVTLFEQHRKLDRSVSEPTSRYKTELCRPFEESGTCKYGDKCQFAHGYNELRNLTRHPKYKTELCRTFHTIGFCPYGPRCHFIHNFEEARIHNEKVNQQLGGVQPNIMGLTPFLNVSAAAANLNISLLEQIATGPHQAISAINNINSPLMRTNSLNIGNQHTAFTNSTLLRANSLNLMTHNQQQQQQHSHQTNSVAIGTRPKPLNLSPTFSLGSTAESVSPSSSLSQSPTNSMASFFSDDCGVNGNLPTTAFSFGQDFGLLAATRQSPSPPGVLINQHSVTDDLIPRTPSPLSPNNESRLPVFNRISSTIGDFENLKI